MQRQDTESNVVKTDSETFASQYEAEKKQTFQSYFGGIQGLRNIATINDDPVRQQTKLSSAEPSKEDFTTTLCAIFSSDADRVPVVGANPGPPPFLGIEPFSLAQVHEAMFKIRCGRGANGGGFVLELWK